jgi:hypothetical protein
MTMNFTTLGEAAGKRRRDGRGCAESGEGERHILVYAPSHQHYCIDTYCGVDGVPFVWVTDFAHTKLHESRQHGTMYPDHSLYDLRGLAKKTNNLATEAEKFRAVHQWICHNIANDYALYHLNKTRREKIKNPATLLAWNEKCCDMMFEVCWKRRERYAITCVIVDG